MEGDTEEEGVEDEAEVDDEEEEDEDDVPGVDVFRAETIGDIVPDGD